LPLALAPLPLVPAIFIDILNGGGVGGMSIKFYYFFGGYSMVETLI
jgi:hypothetical protein